MSNRLFCPQTVSLKGPETGTCLEVPTGSQYSVKFRAKPNGYIYSGYWSDWSDVLTGDTPADVGKLTLRLTKVSVKHLYLFIYSVIPIGLYKNHKIKLQNLTKCDAVD